MYKAIQIYRVILKCWNTHSQQRMPEDGHCEHNESSKNTEIGTGAGVGTRAGTFPDSGHQRKRAVLENFPLLYGA